MLVEVIEILVEVVEALVMSLFHVFNQLADTLDSQYFIYLPSHSN
jgi:hypothetical protein